MSKATEFETKTLKQLGMLAKQRREEVGLHRPALAKEAGIESERIIEDFEFGLSLPPQNVQRKLEKGLAWKLGVIEEVIQRGDRPNALTMEELDAEDSLYLAGQGGSPSLASASDAELLAEVARRRL